MENETDITTDDSVSEEERESIGDCYLCETELFEDSDRFLYTENDDNYTGNRTICDSCAEDKHFCTSCDTRAESVEQIENSWGSRRYCLPCLRESYYACETCELWFRPEDIRSSGYDVQCIDCFECDCGDCSCSDCYPDGCTNECCNDRGSEYIHYYSYKPNPLFFHSAPGTLPGTVIQTSRSPLADTAYLGMELEISIDNKYEGAEVITEASPELVYLKEDGTVEGFELVTHPMTLEAARNSIPFKALRTLRNEYGASGHNNGIHVHVSRKGFKNDSHVLRWSQLFYKNEKAIKRIARRDSSYAKFTAEMRKAQIEHAEKSLGKRSSRNRRTRTIYPDRYSVINVQNSETFEVRVFRGSLRKDEIMASLELVDASVEYTRQLTFKDVRHNAALHWDSFMTWANAQGDKYRNLLDLDAKTRPETGEELNTIRLTEMAARAAADREYHEREARWAAERLAAEIGDVYYTNNNSTNGQ